MKSCRNQECSTAASGRGPPGSAAQMERGIGCERANPDRAQVDRKTQQSRIEYVVRRQSDNQRGAHPDRENRKLNGSRHADQVPASRVVRIRDPCGDPDNGRDEKAAERALEARKKDRSALQSGNHRSPCDGERRAHQQRPKSLHDERPVSVPQAKADRQNLRQKRQEEGRDDNRHRVIVDDAGGQQNAAGRCPGDIAGGDVSQLPEILYDIRERFVHRQGKSGQRLVVHDRPHLARGQRIIRLRKRGRVQESGDECPCLRCRSLHADLLTLRVGAVNEDLGHGHPADACAPGKTGYLGNAFRRKRRSNLMHTGSVLAVLWMISNITDLASSLLHP